MRRYMEKTISIPYKITKHHEAVVDKDEPEQYS